MFSHHISHYQENRAIAINEDFGEIQQQHHSLQYIHLIYELWLMTQTGRNYGLGKISRC